MTSRSFLDSLLPDDAIQTYSALLLLCGIAMLFAIPFTSRVSEHGTMASLHAPSLFFLVHALLMYVLGIARGGAVASNTLRSMALLIGAFQILLGQLLLLPYLLYVRAALPKAGLTIAVVAVYVTLVSLCAGVLGYTIECRAIKRSRSAFVLKAVLALTHFLAPLLVGFAVGDPGSLIVLASPFGAVLHLLERGLRARTLFAFALPAVILVLFLSRAKSQTRSEST